MNAYPIRIKETIALITAEKEFVPAAERDIRLQRDILEDYIDKDPGFLHSLEPYGIKGGAPEIIRRMAEASAKAGVGPMAAVAGAIAESALKAMLKAGADHGIVDNGGDIALYLAKPAVVGIFTGPARIRDIGFLCRPDPRILGICTSSGTVGHSLSFGNADAAIIISQDVCLADAAATALGNAAKIKTDSALEQALESTWIGGVKGMLVIMDDVMAMKGDLPGLVKAPLRHRNAIRPVKQEEAP